MSLWPTPRDAARAAPRGEKAARRQCKRRSIAIRHAIEHRAARPPRVAWILHRHDAAAFADEHAWPDPDRGRVADDHARMRRGQARARAVAPDDGVARKHPAPPSSQLTSVPALMQLCASAGPAPIAAATTRPRIANVRFTPPSTTDLPCSRRHGKDSGSTGRTRAPIPTANPAEKPSCSKNLRKFPLPPPLSLAKSAPSLQERALPERWPSGLRRTLGKRVCGKPYRGFESHSLRHFAPKFRTSKRRQARKFRPFSYFCSSWRTPTVLKMSREWGWRTRFSPNPRTPEIGAVRHFAKNRSLVGAQF